MTEKKFSVNEEFIIGECRFSGMSGTSLSLSGAGPVIVAILLVLAVPAAAMTMTPDSGACGISIFSPSAGQNTQSAETPDCKHDCYKLCALTCSDGWCMIACMKNCDRYCSGEKL
jgi:hypothetical protein